MILVAPSSALIARSAWSVKRTKNQSGVNQSLLAGARRETEQADRAAAYLFSKLTPEIASMKARGALGGRLRVDPRNTDIFCAVQGVLAWGAELALCVTVEMWMQKVVVSIIFVICIE